MTLSNESRYRKLGKGVKVYSAGNGCRKTCYHTRPDCPKYPHRPVEATDNMIDHYELTECAFCKQRKRDEADSTQDTRADE
jgi:hypothetical protein